MRVYDIPAYSTGVAHLCKSYTKHVSYPPTTPTRSLLVLFRTTLGTERLILPISRRASFPQDIIKVCLVRSLVGHLLAAVSYLNTPFWQVIRTLIHPTGASEQGRGLVGRNLPVLNGSVVLLVIWVR